MIPGNNATGEFLIRWRGANAFSHPIIRTLDYPLLASKRRPASGTPAVPWKWKS